jgi:STE24 endopeptidase
MIWRLFLFALIFILTFLSPVPAQEVSPSPASTAAVETTKSFDPTAATKAWLASVPADKRAKSDAYFEGGYWLLLWNFLVGAGIAIFLLASTFSAQLRDFTERLTGSKTLQVVVYAVGFIVVVAVLSFPLTFYQFFLREHQYGFAAQTFGAWFVEQLIGLIVGLIAGIIGLSILYAVFRHAPQTWWLWGTLVAVVLSFFGNLVAPVFVEPLFNTYKPLTDPTIRDPILAMARANQIPVTQVFQVDASRQTTRVSANVAGLLGTTRIALNDNLLKQCSLPEIRAVMAHEMGHYVLNHGAKLTIYLGVVALFGFAIARFVFAFALQVWGERWQVRDIADPAGLPLLMLIFVTFTFLMTPVLNSIVRSTEREADQFGINTSREPDGECKVALKLGAYRKLDPGPLEEFIFFDHPSGRARIQMGMDWKAAHLPCGDPDAPDAPGTSDAVRNRMEAQIDGLVQGVVDHNSKTNGICEVHHVQMTRRLARVAFGMPPPPGDDYDETQARDFPHASLHVAGGCVISHKFLTERVPWYVCPECKRAEHEWAEKHSDTGAGKAVLAGKDAVFPNLPE